MSKRHGAREQKRLAKQKAKRAEKRRQSARASSRNPAIRFQSAASWPIVAAIEPERLWSRGIGNLIIARRAPNSRIVMGVFLVDTYCLGVKDVFWKEVGDEDYKAVLTKLAGSGGPQRNISPERFSKLVHCAVDYAQSLGLPPHPDFHTVRHLMDGIDPSLCHDELEFGKNGKPFYFPGPHDSLAKAQMVAQRVQAAGGEYVMLIDGATPFGLLEDEDDDEWAE
ncbi:MAG TPA: hypothetical protein VG826_02795 [Pirellulales bacterium]|nr:hypothetical protein [Pirellulales bacterium]